MAHVASAEGSHIGRLGAAQRVLAGRRGVVTATTLFLAFSLNFGAYRIFGDGVDYYSFDQRLFGDVAHGSGYNFGTGLLNAPFYALGHLAKLVAGGRIGAHALPASITFASIAYVLVAIVLAVALLERLELPHAGIAVGAALFGSPLWYYASFSPSYTHATDAAAFGAAAYSLYRALHGESRAWYLAFAASLGLEVAVRPTTQASSPAPALRCRSPAVRAGRSRSASPP